MDTLALGYSLPATGRLRDFHPLEYAPAGRTTKKTTARAVAVYLVKMMRSLWNIRVSTKMHAAA